jgi:cytochrome c peroxidase
MKPFSSLAFVCAALACVLSSPTYALTPAEQLAGYTAQAGTPAQPARGQRLFTTKHGKDWSCSSCHTATPTVDGKHASTGKAIGPLAPAFNPERFTDTAKTEKWFRRNCNDVVGRECSATEKADVLGWLLTLKP